jgi:hypothetical protein
MENIKIVLSTPCLEGKKMINLIEAGAIYKMTLYFCLLVATTSTCTNATSQSVLAFEYFSNHDD